MVSLLAMSAEELESLRSELLYARLTIWESVHPIDQTGLFIDLIFAACELLKYLFKNSIFQNKRSLLLWPFLSLG